MLPFVTYGIDDASTTRSPSRPWTRIVSGSSDRQLVDAHPRRARRMERRLGVARDPVEDLLVGLDASARRRLAAVVRRHRRLVEDAARDADGLDPLAPVLVGREVVEAQRRMLARVGRS